MPCYQIMTLSLSMKALNRNLLEEAIKSTGLHYERIGDNFILDNIEIRAGSDTAIVQTGYEGQLNQIKRSYSEHIVRQVTRKKQWNGQWKKTKNGMKATIDRH